MRISDWSSDVCSSDLPLGIVTMRSTPLRAPPSRGLVLAMLLIVYTFNFLDRQMLGILAQPIKSDLGLIDAQFGPIGGLAFALLYSLLGVQLALLAGNPRRPRVTARAPPPGRRFTP